MEKIKTIKNNGIAELVEQKSRFIAQIFYVENENEVKEILNNLKKQYYDARHICFAFSIIKDNQEYTKLSDDGEPSGTAGMPILNIIKHNNLSNVLIAVIRYFGGILLGTGGLIRAYSNSANNVLKNVDIVKKEYGSEYKIEISYQNSEKFNYFCKTNKVKILKVEYKENIFYTIELNEKMINKMLENENSNNKEFKKSIISYVKMCRKWIETVE